MQQVKGESKHIRQWHKIREKYSTVPNPSQIYRRRLSLPCLLSHPYLHPPPTSLHLYSSSYLLPFSICKDRFVSVCKKERPNTFAKPNPCGLLWLSANYRVSQNSGNCFACFKAEYNTSNSECMHVRYLLVWRRRRFKWTKLLVSSYKIANVNLCCKCKVCKMIWMGIMRKCSSKQDKKLRYVKLIPYV